MLSEQASLYTTTNIVGDKLDDIKEKVCDFASLYNAMHKCKRNVMWKGSVAGYVKNGLVNCLKLQQQLYDGSYKIDKYSVFLVHEPKMREIVSTRIKDRVFQRSLCDNYLYEAMTRTFVYDNCACQINKGTDFAMNRLNCHMQRYYRKHGKEGFVLKCDIKNYFGSTRHEVAKGAVRKRAKNEWVYQQVCDIVESFDQGRDPDVGMGLGSQITQLTQLAVLDDLDHFIKEGLRIKYYIRYMDDFILIHEDKAYLQYCRSEIDKRVSLLGLKLSASKTQLFPLDQGIKFLGFKFYLTDAGKVIRKLRRENASKEKRKLRKLKNLVDKGTLTKEHVDECYNSWKAHAKRGDTHDLILSMDMYYKNLWKEGAEDV